MKPAIILVRPQMGENIGSAARVMANFSLSDLRIVAPRDGWPNEKARHLASGATEIIDNARVFSSTAEAIADLSFLLATSARERDMVKPVFAPKFAIAEIINEQKNGAACGILFGAERTGLENSDVVLADALVTVPVSADYASLNLAQAVAILAYEYFSATENFSEMREDFGRSSLAKREDLLGLFSHLEHELDRCDFFKVPTKREKMLQNLRNFILRARLSDQDVRTFRGIIRALVEKREEN